jgi:hypothetical protein
MWRSLVFVVAGCAIAPRPLPATHPSSAGAPVGRLAGASATLRPGVAGYDDLPAPRATEPAHHHHTP